MKVQEVILRAIAKRMTWWQAVEVIGISDRQMRRWRQESTRTALAALGGIVTLRRRADWR